MLPNKKFLDLDLEFWANIKLLDQRLGYTVRKTKKYPITSFLVPTPKQIIDVFLDEKLDYTRLVNENEFTPFGKAIQEYMMYRGEALTNHVEQNLMNKDQAKNLFTKTKQELNPKCPLPLNKQTEDKKDFAFLTGLVNMLIEANIGSFDCNFDPHELTAITIDNFPVIESSVTSTVDPVVADNWRDSFFLTAGRGGQ